MKKHSARVAPLSACNSPVLTLTKVEGPPAHTSAAAAVASASSRPVLWHSQAWGGAPPGWARPHGGPGGGGAWASGPQRLPVLSAAAPQAELGPGGGAMRVRLLGRLHAARQADLPDLRRALHPDVVRHHVELLVLPSVLCRPRVQGRGQAVGEAAVQAAFSRKLETSARAERKAHTAQYRAPGTGMPHGSPGCCGGARTESAGRTGGGDRGDQDVKQEQTREPPMLAHRGSLRTFGVEEPCNQSCFRSRVQSADCITAYRRAPISQPRWNDSQGEAAPETRRQGPSVLEGLQRYSFIHSTESTECFPRVRHCSRCWGYSCTQHK